MSFSVPGSTWVPKSAVQHAQEVLTAINTTLAPLNISIVPTKSNVIWLFCLGIGAVAALFDTSLESAKNSFNPALCDDDQILHMLPITGITRLPATFSTLNVNFTATPDGTLTVPAGTHVVVKNQTYRFVTDEEAIIPANGTVAVATTCDTTGPIQVSVGQADSIVESLANFLAVTNSEVAVAGRDLETVSSVRTRIINGLTLRSNLNGFIQALRDLPGVNQAKVYFNESTVTPLVLPGSITVPVRTLYIVIEGASDLIAETWGERMVAPTYGSQTQQFATLSGQLFDVHYDNAASQPVYVKVYVSSLYPRQEGYDVLIKDAVVALGAVAEIGKMVTAEFILAAFDMFPYATINGAEVSLDDVTYGRTAIIDGDSVPSFTEVNVEIIEEP